MPRPFDPPDEARLDQPSAPWRVFDEPSKSQAPASGAEAATGPAPDWRPTVQPGVIVALAGAALLVVLAVILAVGGIGGSVAVDAAGEPGADASITAGDASGPEIVVAVAGGVARPGVYRLAPGSRVADAIAAAGGFGPRVAASRVDAELNLAAVLRDGERIAVPSRDDPAASAGGAGGAAVSSGGTGSPTGGGSLIDLNRATQSELESLPGIGAVTAAKIIASRGEAPFRTVDELRERNLVGEKTFQKIRPLVTVG
ncbi:MAG TPA: ComEA family DNA-binding protein [Candidatus Eisenbacteria bacterium]|nr:ComEA family DNA-binding protein [Candidatus Eisenbacteria bacterium]